MNKSWGLVSAVGFIAALLSCTSSTAPTSTAAQPTAPLATEGTKAATVATQQPAKPAHHCVTEASTQELVVETVRLTFDDGSDTYLRVCFVSGYQGIECADDFAITNAVGHGLSNRERAECDAVMRRLERSQAADAARKKRLDEAYDKKHGLKPAN